MAITSLQSLWKTIKASRQQNLRSTVTQNQPVRSQDLIPLEEKVNEIVTQVNSNTNLSGYLYKEVAVSSSELLSIGTSSKSILAAKGGSTYFDYFYTIEYTHNGTAYTTVSVDYLFLGGAVSFVGNAINTTSTIEATANKIIMGSGRGADQGVVTTEAAIFGATLGEGIVLTTYNSGNPEVGNGTMLVKIWYKEKSTGTEL